MLDHGRGVWFGLILAPGCAVALVFDNRFCGLVWVFPLPVEADGCDRSARFDCGHLHSDGPEVIDCFYGRGEDTFIELRPHVIRPLVSHPE